MKKYFLFILLSIFLFNACVYKKNNNFTTWLVLLDMSGMQDTHFVRKIYSDNLSKVLKSVKAGDKFIVAMITESSINEPQLIIDYSFPLFEPTTSNELYSKGEEKVFIKKQSSIKDSIYRKLQDLLNNSSRIANHTDIIGSLHIAESIFKKFNNTYKKLVIFSDMEENSDKYSFPNENITKKRIKNIITNEKKSIQGLPDLTNVNIYITGAHSKTNRKFFAVREFWLKFFKECGANCNESNYSSTSISLE